MKSANAATLRELKPELAERERERESGVGVNGGPEESECHELVTGSEV